MNKLDNLPSDYAETYRKFLYLFNLSYDFFEDIFSLQGMKLAFRVLILLGNVLNTISHFCFVVNIFASGKDWMNYSDTILLLFFYIEAFYNIFWYIIRKNNYHNLLYRLAEEWEFSPNENKILIKKKYLFMSNIVVKYYGYAAIATLMLEYLPWLITLMVDVYVLKTTDHFSFKFELILPFDVSNNLFKFLIVYSVHAFITSKIILLKLALMFLLLTFQNNLAINFALLKEDIVNVFNNYNLFNEHTVNNNLVGLIRRHQKLIRLGEELNNSFSEILITTLLGTTLHLCMFTFLLACGRDIIINISEICSISVYVLFFCWYGEKLATASTDIADGVYQSSWYLSTKQQQRMALILIVRSQKPCSVSAMKMVPINLVTFTKIMKISYSFFSFTFNVINK